MNSMQLHHGDCLKVMDRLVKEGLVVDAVICDPPYGFFKSGSCTWDSIIPFAEMWECLSRVVKPHGVMVFTASQPFTTALISSNLKMFKYCWVWVKNRASGHQNAKIKPLNKTENVVVFGKGCITYNPQMVKRDVAVRFRGGGSYLYDGVGRVSMTVYTHRYPITLIEIDKVPQREGLHPTQKPVELMEYLIQTYTNVGETVLDFAMGSGTTGVACVNTGRKFVGIESVGLYYRMAEYRVEKAIKKAK